MPVFAVISALLACACGRVAFDPLDGATLSIAPSTLRVGRDALVEVQTTAAGIEVRIDAQGVATTFQQPAPTDASGRATVMIRGTEAGTYVVTASVDSEPPIELVSKPITVVPGPILALPLDQGAGTSTMDTVSGVTGMLRNNAAWQPVGRFGSALSFDGNAWLQLTRPAPIFTDYIDRPEVTVELHARPTAATGTWAELYGLGGCMNHVAIGISPDGRIVGSIMKDQVATTVLATAMLPLDQWTHVALVKTADTLLLYQDGMEVGRAASPPIWNSGGGIHVVGSCVAAESSLQPMCAPTQRDWFIGDIDEIQVFDYALTPELIAQDVALPATP